MTSGLTPISKGGAPSKYKPEYVAELVPLMEQGYTQAKLCAKWSISRDTFNKWTKDIPEFKEAYEIGKPKLQAWLQEKGMKMVDGVVKGDSKVWGQFMRNVDPEWDPKEDKNSTQITIGNMNVLQQKDNTELLEILQQRLTKLNQYQPVLKVIDDKSERDE